MSRLGINVRNFGPGTDPESFLHWAGFPFVLPSWLAGQTTSVRLGTSVTVLPYRHPLLTARMSAVAHVLSGGRFVLGVGVDGQARSSRSSDST